MSSLALFAAVDQAGTMRFVEEVPRGHACGCFCPECGSPLVAKQGDEKIWHFAHEADQERVECKVGAMNMMRRLAVEYLASLPALVLPRFERTVTVLSSRRRLAEAVGWGAQPLGAPQWLEPGSHGAPVATMRLDNGIEVDLHVEISESPTPLFPQPVNGRGSIVFWSTLPVVSDLRKRIYAVQHLARWGKFIWRHQPDVFDLVDAARARLQKEANRDDERERAEAKRASEEAGRRWAKIEEERLAGERIRALRDAPIREAVAPSERSFEWAPEWNPGSSFIFYRLRDGSAWVLYTMKSGRSGIAPWPRDEGWDEALPASVGSPDPALGLYVTANSTNAMIFLSKLAAVVRSSSNPDEFAGL